MHSALISMGRAGKTYVTFNKLRLALFIRSYAGCLVTQYIRTKYKIDGKSYKKELRSKFKNKRSIPEISKLAKLLSFNYTLLRKWVVLDKTCALSKKISAEDKIKVFLSVERELTTLKAVEQDKESLIDKDYESATLISAIERAAGNSLRDIDDDFVFEEQLEELQRKYRRLYYKTTYEYKLPTLRIIPFILRLLGT